MVIGNPSLLRSNNKNKYLIDPRNFISIIRIPSLCLILVFCNKTIIISFQILASRLRASHTWGKLWCELWTLKSKVCRFTQWLLEVIGFTHDVYSIFTVKHQAIDIYLLRTHITYLLRKVWNWLPDSRPIDIDEWMVHTNFVY